MHRPLHAIGPVAGRRMPTERMVGIGFVVLLHVVAIWALVTGMIPGVVPKQATDLTVVDVPKDKTKDVTPPQPPTIPTPTDDFRNVQPPTYDIDNGPAITLPPPTQGTGGGGTAGVSPDTAAAGIVFTHTTPDYPALARKMGEQGRVTLRLSIAADGAVTGAAVEQSSGFADLDQTAVDWVIAHWRYKPAMQGGAAVAGTARAVVVFNLRNAR
jgi:periplasmic protein TonB